MKKLLFTTLIVLFLFSCSDDENKSNSTAPVVSTTNLSNITINGAVSGGIITSDGGANITARGVVWSTSQNPTIALTTKTIDGAGTGSFTSLISNLISNTTYYVKAYATNSVGTSYGNEITFTTVVDVTTGLIAFYPFNGNANDASGNGNNGSYNGTLINDRLGNSNSAISLNGINNMITLPGNNGYNTDTFTINFWTYANSYNIHQQVQYGVIGSSGRFSLGWKNTNIGYSPNTCAGGYALSGNSTTLTGVQTGQWHMLTYVIQGTTTKFYLNGNFIQTVNTASNLTCFNSNMNLYLGGDILGGVIEYYNGRFDDIRTYSRALNQSEISYLFNN